MGLVSFARVSPFFLALATALAPLTTSATSAGTTATHPSEVRVRAEIMPLFKAMQEAANIHDAEAHLAPFVRGSALTFVVNGRTIQGWDDLIAQQRIWWPGGKIAPTGESDRPYRLVEGPSFQVFSSGLAMITFVLDSRRVYPDRVVRRPLAISQLWEKRSEGWRIVHAHESIGPERPEI